MMTVNLGTCAHATAMTILAPSLALPPASYLLPTMKPGMGVRGRGGHRVGVRGRGGHGVGVRGRGGHGVGMGVRGVEKRGSGGQGGGVRRGEAGVEK